jgi:beta-lactamase superfamily II metal-dependent hydrolase
MGRSTGLLLSLLAVPAGGCIDTGGVAPAPDGGGSDADADGDSDSDGDTDGDADGPLVVTFIDVGQGDAALYELPDGSAILVDGGPNGAGNSAIVPLLWDKGIVQLELVVLTHPHADHCGGLDEVLQLVAVAEIWENGETLETASYQGFAAARDAEGAEQRIAAAGDERWFGDVLLTVLAADRGMEGENNDSVVLAFDFAGRRVLAAADIEAEAQALLLDEHGAGLASDVVKVPHHGSWNFDQSFVEVVAADFGAISCGENNDFGHPHQVAIDAWLGVGTTLCRTDLSGDVAATIGTAGDVTFDCADPITP